MNIFTLGWVETAPGKLCNYLFEWDVWIGLVLFSLICDVLFGCWNMTTKHASGNMMEIQCMGISRFLDRKPGTELARCLDTPGI